MQASILTKALDVFIKDPVSVAQSVAAVLAETANQHDVEAGLPTEEVALLKESGLLLLPVPRQYGGAGATWPQLYQVVKILAAASGSVGQLYANHIALVNTPAMLGRPGQADDYYRLTARHNYLWANALNARDARLTLQTTASGYCATGIKSFGTGMAIADLNVIGAVREDGETPVVFIIPGDRAGVHYHHDWHAMGQRRTVSGSYSFQQVAVDPEELLGPPAHPDSAFLTLVFLISQLGKAYTYLGVAEGALQAAKDYTTTATRPWQGSGVEQATQDPYILHQYGELWADLQAAIALANQAAEQIQWAWQQQTQLTFEDRGQIGIVVAAAKATAIRAGLAITNQIFDLMGARSTARRYGFERYWRDLRTFSLHDPRAYKYRDIGNWFLNQVSPPPSQYS